MAFEPEGSTRTETSPSSSVSNNSSSMIPPYHSSARANDDGGIGEGSGRLCQLSFEPRVVSTETEQPRFNQAAAPSTAPGRARGGSAEQKRERSGSKNVPPLYTGEAARQLRETNPPGEVSCRRFENLKLFRQPSTLHDLAPRRLGPQLEHICAAVLRTHIHGWKHVMRYAEAEHSF